MTARPNGWVLTRFGEVAHVSHGWPFKSPEYSTDAQDPVVVSIGNFDYTGGFRFDRSTIKHYAGAFPGEFTLSAGDLLLVMTCQTEGGEILGVPGVVPDDGRIYLHNQRIGRVHIDRPDLLDARFAFHLARWDEFNRQLAVTATGSKILHTSPARIAATTFASPPLVEQRAIAEVLGALDDKIAANTRVAQRARKLAEAEFVALSSMRTERSTVGAIMKLEYGKALPTNQRTSGGVDVFGSGGVVGSHDKALVSAPGVVIGRKGTAGAVHWAPRAFFPIDTTFYVVPRSESISAIFCYFTLRSLKLAERNSDSAVPGLNRAEAESTPIMLPPVDALTGFTENATALFDLATQADSASATLAAIRDALLPALMSGSLRVRDVERAVEQTV